MEVVIENGKATTERAIVELNQLCQIWTDYQIINEEFVQWLNKIELEFSSYRPQNDEKTFEDLTNFQERIMDKDKVLEQIEQFEWSIPDYDWSRQVHNAKILRER